MKNKVFAFLFSVVLSASLLVGCGAAESMEKEEANKETVEVTEVSEEVPEKQVEATEIVEEEPQVIAPVDVRIAALKGPTTMGLVKLVDDASKETTLNHYQFEMKTQADEILPLLLKGDLDMALIPANAASVLYKKSEGKICVVDINTLGVLYLVSGDDTIASVEDLKGKTVYLTGKGTTPDYVLQDVLAKNGVTDDVTLEYKAEATEVAATLAADPTGVGLLPQPFVTAACIQNEKLSTVMDMNEEWAKVHDGNGIITGVTVCTKAFLEEHQDAVDYFIAEHKDSVNYVNENVEAAAELVAKQGIVEKAPVAMKAIPKCNLVAISGTEMKESLSAYLEVLLEANAEFIGGSVPGDDFYYLSGE